MRDINPNGDNWIDDAIEWIGEALEHIGSAPQLEKKTCVISLKNHKAALPNDLYYINQVAFNQTSEGVVIENQMDSLLDKLDDIINGGLATGYTVNEINARVHVLENQLINSSGLTVLTKCTTNFPENVDCPDCINDNNVVQQCYYIEADKIKTSFNEGKVCLSYMAFPIDDECYPMVPDDISFKEAMFWYVYKKMLLGNMNPSVNGIGYEYADMQWKYYCTQARNNANYPDIDQYESFLDQWVRLIPNINRHSEGFGNLNLRESLSRDRHKYLVDSMPLGGKVPTKAVESGLTKKGSLINWGINSADSQLITAGNNIAIQLNNPLTGDYSQVDGSVAITYAPNFWLVTGMSSQNTIQYSYTITPSQITTAGNLIVEVVAYNLNTSQDIILESTTFNLTTEQTEPLSGVAENIVGSMSNARVFVRVTSPTEGGAAATLLFSSGDLRIV